MENTDESVSQGIRVLMLRKGMKQSEIVKAAGLKLTYFSSRINGHRGWTLNDLDRIAAALGLSGAADIISVAEREQSLAA